ncbi:hypothetical protein MAR_024198 [Mya arenaria]|uniref:G-protein coupled receptors family 1 profile domain-containing protein n=1 Tax=Mya arenaria TaxID=6604 RepID=A0ABY7DT24_MYAAR|nr:hypothetical protein MAR_024198 [Mya arenaria]
MIPQRFFRTMNMSINGPNLPVTIMGNGPHYVTYLLNESLSNTAGWNSSQNENNTDDYNNQTLDYNMNNIYYDQKMHESFLSNIHRHSATFIGVLACWTCFINIILLHASHPTLYSWLFKESLTKGIICTPWVIGLVIVVPIWTSGTIPFDEMTNQCVVIVAIEAAIVCPVLTYFVPLAILGFLTFRMLLLRLQYASLPANVFETDRNTIHNNHFELEESTTTPLHKPGDTDTQSSNQVQKRIDRQDANNSSDARVGAASKLKSSKIVAVCLVNVVNTVLWFPFQILSLLLSVCHFQSCIPSFALNQVFTLMGAASAGVVPLFWFFDTELRKNIVKLCSRKQNMNLQGSVHSDKTCI